MIQEEMDVHVRLIGIGRRIRPLRPEIVLSDGHSRNGHGVSRQADVKLELNKRV